MNLLSSDQYNTAIDLLLQKLPQRLGYIDLLSVVRDINLADDNQKNTSKISNNDSPKSLLTPLEQHLIKGALPHVIELARVCPNTNVGTTIEEESTPLNLLDKRRVPLKPTSLIAASGPLIRKNSLETSEPVLTDIGNDADILAHPSLLVSVAQLRDMLYKLPRWISWNAWTANQKREIRDSCAVQKPLNNCHYKCKIPTGLCQTNQIAQSSEHACNPPFIPKVRSHIPMYLLRRRGLSKDDPLVLLRYYCKHFHPGQWVRDYEALVDDLRECTFQPNIHRYLKPSIKDLRPPDDPFLGNNPFASIKEDYEYPKDSKCTKHQDKRSFLSKKPFDDYPEDPKYRGPYPLRHRSCLTSQRYTPTPSVLLGKKKQSVSGKKQRVRPWHLTLRDNFDATTDSSIKTLSSSLNKLFMRNLNPVLDDRKRYQNYDWGKCIRLRQRNLVPVCVPNVGRLEAVLRDAAPPWLHYEEKNVLKVDRPAFGRENAVTFLVQRRPEEYKINQARNFHSVIRYGVDSGELLAPLAVVGVKVDPILGLEQRLAAAKPISLVEYDKKN